MNLKLNPPQHSVKELLGLGIQPDLLLCRTKKVNLNQDQKISLFCNISLDSVIMIENAKTIYEVPLKLYKEGYYLNRFIHTLIYQKKNKIKFKIMERFLKKFNTLKHYVNVAIVGKIYKFV